MTFKNWIISTGLTIASARNYEGAIYGTISRWAEEAGLIKSNLVEVDEPEEFDQLSEAIKQLKIFQNKNSVGHQMYSAALNKYSLYLKSIQKEVEEDIETLSKDDSVSETEKDRLIKSRLGQGSFRRSLKEYWQGCSVTGYQFSKLLIASHIKPWRSSDNKERMDMFNGLLLIPNIDKAFDKGFISFQRNGDVLISEILQKPELLGIKSDLRIRVSDQHLQYLKYHREIVFIDSKQLTE